MSDASKENQAPKTPGEPVEDQPIMKSVDAIAADECAGDQSARPRSSNNKVRETAAGQPAAISLRQTPQKERALRKSDAFTIREPATELELFWSVVAAVIFVVIATFIAVIFWRWYVDDKGLKATLSIIGPNGVSKEAIKQYCELSNQAFQRAWQLVDRVVLGGLMSLLTLILGYVFGIKRRT